MKRLIALCLSSSLVLIAHNPLTAGGDPQSPAAKIEASESPSLSQVLYLKHCRLEYHETTRLGSPLSSFLQELNVGLGDKVKAGQVVGRLFDQEVRAQLDQFAMKAESDILIELAKTDLALAQTKLAKTENLEKRSFASNEVLVEDRYNVQKARISLANAEFDKKLARIDQRRLQGEVRAREFVAPHDGVVVEILKNQGESLLVGDPVLRIVNPKRMKVWGSVNVPDLWKIKLGQPVRVVVEIPGVDVDIEHEVFLGRVAFISNEVVKETQTAQVLAVIDNRDDLLKGGLYANMEIDLAGEAVPPSKKSTEAATESPKGNAPLPTSPRDPPESPKAGSSVAGAPPKAKTKPKP